MGSKRYARWPPFARSPFVVSCSGRVIEDHPRAVSLPIMAIDMRAVRAASSSVRTRVSVVTVESVKSGIDGFDPKILEAAGFRGEPDQTYMQPSGQGIAGLVGVGSHGDLDPRALRRAGGVAARACSRHARVALELPEVAGVSSKAARRALTEGVMLGGYRYTALKSSRASGGSAPSKRRGDDANGIHSKLGRAELVGSASAASKAAVRLGSQVADGVCLARDLVNEPGGSLTPPNFARKAAEIAADAGLACEVWTEAQIDKERLCGLLGVNRGSTQPPRFVKLSYRPALDEPLARLAWVGKGITFDAGGLSIKTATGMLTMKSDMAGAAAVIAAMSVLPSLSPPVAVDAYLPMTDNMLGGDATRPGDVLTIRNGKTIEVANTDAEGRLVLADALSMASETAPDAIVDIATLTGACKVALGPRIAGVMGNDQALIDRVRLAADLAGERVWPLPLPADYAKQFESSVADMKNVGGAHGGALTAGLILQQFVGEGIPWAHIDIAGPAMSETDDGEIVKGATGFGVRTLIELADSFADSATLH